MVKYEQAVWTGLARILIQWESSSESASVDAGKISAVLCVCFFVCCCCGLFFFFFLNIYISLNYPSGWVFSFENWFSIEGNIVPQNIWA